MTRGRRLTVLLALGAVAIAGTAAWALGSASNGDRPSASEACDERGAALANRTPLVTVTAAQRKEALALVAADPSVRELWGGVPPIADRLGGVGLFIHHTFPVIDNGPLGLTTSVTAVLPEALPEGTYRWRAANWVYRNDCWADGVVSVTIRDMEGGPDAIGVGQHFARNPVLLVEVSLARKLVVAISPNGGEPTTWRPIGDPLTFTTSGS